MPTPVPGQPHPDVEIVKGLLRPLVDGSTISKTAVSAALGNPPDDVLYRRVKTARDQLRRDEGIDIVAVRGEGYHRQLGVETLARHQGAERLGMHRKARKAGQSLATVDATQLSEDKRFEYFAARTINNAVYNATSHASKVKMISAVAVSNAELPMAKALEVLKNGG